MADETSGESNLSPQALNGTTVRINLLVADPDQLSERAIAMDMAMVRLPLLAV